VTTWLRAHGVTGDRPLHTLRKEFGSIICAAADIYTASRQLRHKQLGTTAAHYTDHRRRDTVPVGGLLAVAAATEAQTNQLQLPLFESGKT
jgi:integrase